MIHAKKAALAAALLFMGSSSALAAPQDKHFLRMGVDLWRGTKTGMTKEELGALGIEEKFELVEDCRVKFSPRFLGDILYSVSIISRWTVSYNKCGELVNRSLVAKYGESANIADKKGEGILETRGIFIEEQWVTDSLVISLGHNPASGRFFYLNYEPRALVQKADLIEGL